MKNLLITLLLTSVAGLPSARAADPLIPVTLASYFTTSAVGFVLCLDEGTHSDEECLLLATITSLITLDAYDKEALQQATDDAAAFLAGAAQPSALLHQVFATMRAGVVQQSGSPQTDEDLAYAVLRTSQAALAD